MVKESEIKKKFNDNGYLIIKKFFSKENCDNFLRKIKKYSNNDYAPIMNPDRIEFLISQTTDKLTNFKYLGDKANFINNMTKDTMYFRSVMLDKKNF